MKQDKLRHAYLHAVRFANNTEPGRENLAIVGQVPRIIVVPHSEELYENLKKEF